MYSESSSQEESSDGCSTESLYPRPVQTDLGDLEECISILSFKKEATCQNIPKAPSPFKSQFNEADAWFFKKKQELEEKLPIFSQDEINQRRFPFNAFLMNKLIGRGQHKVIEELYSIQDVVKKENGSDFLTDTTPGKMGEIVNCLLKAEKLKNQGEIFGLLLCRKVLAQKLLKGNFKLEELKNNCIEFSERDYILAKYFYQSCIRAIEDFLKFQPKEEKEKPEFERFRAEFYIMIALITREEEEFIPREAQEFGAAIDLLKLARSKSLNNMMWQFPNNLFVIHLNKPITFHGLKPEIEDIHSGQMNLYLIATILEQDLLLNLAWRYSGEDAEKGIQFARDAVELALEAKHPIAISSALLRLGLILFKNNNLDDSLQIFQDLYWNSELHGDVISQAIALNNMGKCFKEKGQIIEALDCFSLQKEIATTANLCDLEADALRSLGLILLSEGQLWEAEICLLENFDTNGRNCPRHPDNTKDLEDLSWALAGMNSGLKNMSRLSSAIRLGQTNDIFHWKTNRVPYTANTQENDPEMTKPQLVVDTYLPFYDLTILEETEDKSLSQIHDSLREWAEWDRRLSLSGEGSTDIASKNDSESSFSGSSTNKSSLPFKSDFQKSSRKNLSEGLSNPVSASDKFIERKPTLKSNSD